MKNKFTKFNPFVRGLLINLFMIFIWIFILPRFVEGFVFELLSYFLIIYVIIILILSLKIDTFIEKTIFSYSSFSILIVFSIFLLVISFNNESFILFLIFILAPIVISSISKLVNKVFKN